MKRILFCTPAPLTRSLGAAKVVVELAEEMRLLGWACSLICPADIAAPNDPLPVKHFAANLRHYLQAKAGDYDVVDYDHEHLPYPRADFSPHTLFVARSVLLVQHLDQIIIPTGRGLRAKVGTLLKSGTRDRRRDERISNAQKTVEEADVITVGNSDDKVELMRRGIAADRIFVLPYGLSRAQRLLLNQVSSKAPPHPCVVFVGTFDYRKGAREFPEIVSQVVAAVPEAQFKLLGTKGMFQTESEVRSQFPRRLQQNLDVLPTYKPEELSQLLSAGSVGIFPSYLEGFGFGVLEMLAASVPVIAYETPGPTMMLPKEYLVPRGNADALAQKVVDLLQDDGTLREARCWAKRRSRSFQWTEIAEQTSRLYSCCIQEQALQRLDLPSASTAGLAR